MFKKNVRSGFTLLACCLFFFFSPFLLKQWEKGGNQAVICWDNYGYYLYLPSFFYDDLGKLHNYDYIHRNYHPAGDAKDQAFLQPTGYYVMNYSCGQAILYLPGFAAGHLWAKAAGFKPDGFTLPYQISLTFLCVFVACLGLWLMRRLLLRYFEDWVVAVCLGIICLATNYYFYVSFSILTHAFLFTIYALILYLTDNFYRERKRRVFYSIAIGLLSGLATITRPTEIICVIIPLFWAINGWDGVKKRCLFFWDNKKFIFLYILGACMMALPQLIYWKVYAGHWLFFSYHGDDKTFSFLRPHVLNVLFSYEKGWFMYTPVMILSVLGFYQLYRNYRSLFWSIAAFSLVNLYLVSSWDCWWYGGSFSMRALIQSYALLMFPMAAFLDDFLRRKYWQFLIAAFILFTIWLNLLMSYQAKNSIIEGENTTCAYYWRILGKTSVTAEDKKLMDNDEQMPASAEPGLKEIYRTDMEDMPAADTGTAHSGRRALRLDARKQFTERINIPVSKEIHKGWYRVYANVFFPDKEWNVWDQAQFTIIFTKGDKIIKQKMIRIQRVTEKALWTEVYLDIKAPQGEYDSMGVYFWNANSTKAIYIDDLHVAYSPM